MWLTNNKGVGTHYSVWILAHSSVLYVTAREVCFIYWYLDFYPVFMRSTYTYPRELSAPWVQLRAALRSGAGSLLCLPRWASGSVQHGGLMFSYCMPPHQPLPRAPYSANRVDMLVPRGPEHLQGKGRKLRGILSFSKNLGPWGCLWLYSFTGDVVGWRICFLME